MALSKPKLWQALQRLKLDGKGSLPYSGKLGREEGWSAEDSNRVITEYRRFLYLSQILDAPIAPPEPIDAAWRMHLTYTRSYWLDTVETTLNGRALHRTPEDVGDKRHQRSFYKAATEAYAREFGDAPPPDIWVRPGRLSWNETWPIFFVIGFVGAFGSGIGIFVTAVLAGMFDWGDNTLFAQIFRTTLFLSLGCVLGSPLWAWLVTFRNKTLKSTKRPKRQGNVEFGISIGRGDVAD